MSMMDETVCPVHSGVAEAIRRFDGWQKNQNGALIRIDQKVDRLLYWLMGEMAALILLAVGVFVKR